MKYFLAFVLATIAAIIIGVEATNAFSTAFSVFDGIIAALCLFSANIMLKAYS